ncbi:EAL domain-containing protein [bacterium]|nr:EAL domain-containing protein [bacterium]
MDVQARLRDLLKTAIDPQTAQDFIVDSVKEAFKISRATIMLYNKTERLLEATASSGHPNKDFRAIRVPILRMEGIGSRAVECRAFLDNRTIVIRDRTPDPEYRMRHKFPHKQYAREFGVFPLEAHSRKIGILAVAVDDGCATGLTPALNRKIRRLTGLIARIILATRPKPPSDRFLAKIMKDILQDGLMWMAYQPIVDVRKKTVHSYEALLRINHPVIKDTSEFLTYAEKFNLFRDVSHFGNRQALRALPRLGHGQKLFLNLHPVDFREYGDLDDRANPFYKQDLSRIVFEITERQYVKDTAWLNSKMKFFKGLGAGIAIDDLGSGYSSLEMLTQLEPDYIKLDMSLIRNIHQSDRKQKLIRSLLYYGEQIGARCIAEGVESMEELETLMSMKCSLIQGFLLARPAAGLTPMKDIRKNLRVAAETV